MKKTQPCFFNLFILLTGFFAATVFAQYQQPDVSMLTLAERQELQEARSKALCIPAVQSTRQIARIALHQAMLKTDPTVDTIFANMNAHAPKNELPIAQHKKHVGIKFNSWLANYPQESVALLTPADRQKLEVAHQKALQAPAFIAARKTARITFYHAMINIDPKIIPVLTKVGMKMPDSIRKAATNSKIGSEEKILGGNSDAWDNEILVPAIEEMKRKQ